MSKISIATLLCFFSCPEGHSMGIDAVATQITIGKTAYCYGTQETSDQLKRDVFYGHIAGQHFGLGLDSYARYSSNFRGGDIKLLRSEFVLAPAYFSEERAIVRQGALCLWCREILDVHVKPQFEQITSTLTPVLKIISGIKNVKANVRSTVADQQATIITKVKKTINSIGELATFIEGLSAAITSKLGIIRVLLGEETAGNFRTTDGSDTGIAMNSIARRLEGLLANLVESAQTCRDVSDKNTADTLDLATLQQLESIKLSDLSEILKQLENHILYARSVFANAEVTAKLIAKKLFEEILNNGTLAKNGPHAAPLINLYYRRDPVAIMDPAGITMKAEVAASWYDVTDGICLVDKRQIVQRILLGFAFDGTNLSYGSMFPVTICAIHNDHEKP